MVAMSRTVRPNFFSGRLLTDDLRDEQAYHREKHRRHLQLLHGVGVADGLNVGVHDDGTTVSVEPGHAIDASGKEVVVPDVIVVPIPLDAPSPTCVIVKFIERMMDAVPTADGRSEPSWA